MADSPPTKQRKLDCSTMRSHAGIAKKKKDVFAQRQPPLSVAIKRILDRYPDGQIMKELLQNAEDAGATELRLILDKRQFGKEKLYDERLSVCQGPALLAYNDAMFTKDDWKNIQKTEHSYKELDSKKIGRFGIGFNSIYHLTDVPWILSGNTIGVFDPCERGIFRDPINGHPVGGYHWDITDEDDKNEIKQFSDQFEPLKYDDFDPKFASRFNGTLFRFPLRQQFVEPDDDNMVLSKVKYSPEKILELFKAFETDGDRLLLFLTSIQKVSLWVCSDDNKMVESYSVRKEVQSTIPKPLESIGNYCYYEADIMITQNTGSLSLTNSVWTFSSETTTEIFERWAVVQHISKDPDITNLVLESELNLLPWVGVASPLDVESRKADGYISCFLPLPPDKESRTGLPIEVHGCFCLSESRRSVLWPSAVAQNDRQREWNEKLAERLIPYAYIHLLEQIKERNSNSDAHTIISHLWPVHSQVKHEWRNIIVIFYEQALNKELFWSFVTNKWVTVSDAVFLDPNLEESDRNAIQKICSVAKKSVVSVPTHVPDDFQDFTNVTVIHVSAEYICKLFKEDPTLLQDQFDVKKQLLNYVLSDTDCPSFLKEVPLLPLADGSFVSFNRNAGPVYVSSSEHPRSLLPGLDSLFLSDEYCSVMSDVLASGFSQLCMLQPKDIPALLIHSIENGYWKAEKELENLWQYINRYYIASMDLTEWKGLSIIPILSESQLFTTCYINSADPVLSSDGIDSNVCQWLKNEFGLKLVSPMPYLKHWVGSNYIMSPEIPGSALKVIHQIWKEQPQTVVSAVQKSYSEHHSCFLWLQNQILLSCALMSGPFSQNMVKFLSELPLFHPVNGTNKGNHLISALEAKTYYFKDPGFDIEKLLCQIGFPFPLMSFDFNSTLISKLKLNEMSLADFVTKLLNGISDDGYFSGNKKSVISWVVTHLQGLIRSSATFKNLSSQLVLEEFKEDVQHLVINKRPEYANFCALLLNATETIWEEISHLKVIPCGNNHLHCPAELVMSCDFKNLCPYICEPSDWVKSETEFISRCKIRDSLSLDDMVNIVRNIQKEHGKPQKPLDENTILKGFMEIMNEIAKNAKKFEQSQAEVYQFNLPLPDSMGYLWPVDELLYNNLSTSDQSDYHVVHQAIPKHIALYFGAKTLCDVRLEQYEDKKEFGEEFGQEVDVVERLRHLQDQYHTQSDLFQEFLQNADDAGSTQIDFFFDKRCHPKKFLLSEKSEELQESAILIYNDSTFSDDDIRGIQQLGVGSKADNPEKIGRFGAGFNCAYRYTDCPSFLSNDADLCVFDPLQMFLNKSKKRGRKFKVGQTDFRKEFPAVYNTYQIKGFPLKGATMYRLPLRKVQRKLSLGKLYDVSEVQKLFETVAHSMKEMMLFLRNVKKVSAYESDVLGNFKQIWQFQSETSGSTWLTKEEFGQKVHEFAKCSPSQIPVKRSSYQLELKQANQLHQENWIICQRLGFVKKPVPDDFSKVKLLPVAGVAARLDSGDHKHSLFCSLPLPQLTKMPVSINGHFSLDSEGRKNLFTTVEGEKDVRQQWNNNLQNDAVTNSYLDLLEVLKMNIVEGNYFNNNSPIEKIMKFWTFLPHMQQQYDTTAGWPGAKNFSNNLFKMFAESDRSLFPCLAKYNGMTSIEWLNLKGNKSGPLFPSHTSFQFGQLQDSFLLLHELGIKIIPCPLFILKAFADASVIIPMANPITVANYLREPWINITTDGQKLPCPLTDTVFKSEKRVLSLLQFLLESGEFEEKDKLKKIEFNLGGLPLLVTSDTYLRCFSSSCPAKIGKDGVIQLFSGHAEKFVCKELRSILQKYLKKHGDDATVTSLKLQDLGIMLPGEMFNQGIQFEENIAYCRCPDESIKWLSSLWSLINNLTTDKTGENQFLENFRNFYLIPAKMKENGPLLLFSINMRSLVVHPDMWRYISENYHIEGLPIVNIEHFSHIRSSVFGQPTPEKLSDCLVYWNQHLKWPSEIESQRRIAYDLVTYFRKFSSGFQNLQNLKNLPIFETVHDQFEPIMNQMVFTLDGQESLPINGQDIWMGKALFLRNHHNFKTLYDNLHIGHKDLPQLYAEFIIPSFPDMSTVDQVMHMQYLHLNYNLERFEHVIQVLTKTKFVKDINGTKKSINQFYDHTVPLFEEMCSHEVFLPQYFCDALESVGVHWLQEFLHKLGLKYIAEPKEHVTFALQLSNLPLETNLEKIKRVSKLLLDSAAKLSSSSSESESAQWINICTQMSDIAFIPSMKFDENLRSLYPFTTTDSVQLLKTNGSCSSECNSLVWTVTSVLPDWVPLELNKKMGIWTFENGLCFKDCLKHFEKLLKFLFSAKLQQQRDDGMNSPNSREVLKVVLSDFYRFLNNHQNKWNSEDNKQKIMKLPLILVDEGRHLAYPEMTVKRLPTSDSNDTSCYAPFLYELPHLLYEYENLFTVLGLKEKPCLQHYIMYLQNVHDYLPEDGPKLDPNLRKSVLSVQHAMITSVDKTVDWDSIESVYLFSSDGKLHRSSELLFWDCSVAMQVRVLENKALKFWECSPNAGPILLKKMAEFVQLLPDHLKLKLSSEVLTKCVSDEKSEVCQYKQLCPAVDKLKTLFSSAQFLESIQRLYAEENSNTDCKNERKWEEIHEKLQSIQIHCYSKLIIDIKDLEHSEVIENADEECVSFLDGKMLHISHEDVAQGKFSFASNLAGNLQQFLSMKLQMALCALFLCSEPCDLGIELDKLHVATLPNEFLHVSCLPDLGTHVPAELVHFLEMHPLNYFRNGEYVAFLKPDAEDDPMHNFVWAKIICCKEGDSTSALCRHYNINAGDSLGHINVSALDLHKVITQIKCVGNGPLVPTDIEPDFHSSAQYQMPTSPNKDLTEKEACDEVTQILEEAMNLPEKEYQKVIRRLYLTWHPDKNRDKKTLATNVFKHLKKEIGRLENCGASASQTLASDHSWDSYCPSWDFYRKTDSQQWNDYSQGRTQNPFHHFSSASQTSQEHPDPRKAKKYWKQANYDLNGACDARLCQSTETGKNIGNELVIYYAHQAVEKALKAAMYAEIGGVEKHHNLSSLAQKAVDRTRCSKHVVYTVSKFVSECDADISRLRYPEGHASTPHDTYTESQAQKAVDYAKEIVDDLGKTYPDFKL